ncbi:MAG: DUF4417 domain-containing protein [Bacilli bacterium]
MKTIKDDELLSGTKIRSLFDLIITADEYSNYLLNHGWSFLSNGFPDFTNKQTFFLKTMPNDIIPYPQRNNWMIPSKNKVVICFFCRDYLLYRRLSSVLHDIPELKKYGGVVEMDITVTEGMDKDWQDFLMLLNQLYLAILIENGIFVMPNTRCGDSATIGNLAHIPKNVIWCSSFLGCKNISSNEGLSGYIDKVLSLNPQMIIIYGKHDKRLEKQLDIVGVNYKVYKDFRRKNWQRR